jgi:hypothetical protein
VWRCSNEAAHILYCPRRRSIHLATRRPRPTSGPDLPGRVLLPGRSASRPWKSPPWPTLRDLGYAEDTNLVVERRFAAGRRDKLATFATELVALKPDVILTQGAQAAEAASNATHEIPVVVMGAGDPVGTGLVKSLAHPGENVTGVAEMSTVLSGKAPRIAYRSGTGRVTSGGAVERMWGLGIAGHSAAQAVTHSLGLQVQVAPARTERDLDEVFAPTFAPG